MLIFPVFSFYPFTLLSTLVVFLAKTPTTCQCLWWQTWKQMTHLCIMVTIFNYSHFPYLIFVIFILKHDIFQISSFYLLDLFWSNSKLYLSIVRFKVGGHHWLHHHSHFQSQDLNANMTWYFWLIINHVLSLIVTVY